MELEAHVIATYLFPEKTNKFNLVEIAQYKLASKLDTEGKTRFYVPGNKNLFDQDWKIEKKMFLFTQFMKSSSK